MPLHLLGKKSWNVYNPESIARVKRDEAAAKAYYETEERERRNDAAANRLSILRGEEVLVLPSNVSSDVVNHDVAAQGYHAPRKRRKLAGEDDTDRDIRLARQEVGRFDDNPSHANSANERNAKSSSSSVRDREDQREPSANQELAGMRFKDAAGYGSKDNPWYVNQRKSQVTDSFQNQDVWGNEDLGRRERQQKRIDASDPLLAMKRGVKQLRENDRQRKEWIEQREKDLYEVEKLARQKKTKLHRRDSDEDSIEELDLDAQTLETDHRAHRKGDSERNRHHHQSKHRSRSPERRRHHRRHHHHRYRSRE